VPSTDGVELAVHDLGGTGRATLLAHATGFHGQVWRPLAAHLDGHHAVAPDLRGHGASRTPDDLSYAWEGFADDVLSVVDALGLERPLGVGHSKGGAALLRAEIRRPGTFRAIWCFEPVVFPPEVGRDRHERNPLADGALRRRTTFPSYESAIENFRSKPPMAAFDPAAVEAYVRGGFRPTPDGSVTLRCRPQVEAEVYRMGSHHDTFERLAGVACPVVVARGVVDAWGPAAFAERIVAALPTAELHAFGHVGHFGPLEDPAGMAADVRALSDATASG
jgi:pimeloyl-ACP methyl ester carboxylesterase